ncbi:MAG: TIGR03084 family metal-binding protein [Nocardioides sp.]|uniref:TIGR03084 family metal-binding protein n=1 Tax=Nocardioides sp. TaxID=35761 RepID=UPI0039E657FA
MSETTAALVTEGEDLDRLVADLPAGDWQRPTPAAGWSIAHQIGHLAWTDDVAVLAIRDEDGFDSVLAAAASNPFGLASSEAERWSSRSPDELVQAWRSGRRLLADLLDQIDPETRIRWFGPSMGVRSMATARLMETWAHGQDVADALGVQRRPTQRLRDIAFLGVRTRDFAYQLHGHPVPDAEFRIELTGPDGEVWAWGEPGGDTVTGTALDFCLVVTQRRGAAETDLVATGEARHWLEFAQIFAPPATTFGHGRNDG